MVAATAVVAFLTKPPESTMSWTVLKDVDHLKAEVARARMEGKAVVVDVGATWCTYCKKYEHLIAEKEALRTLFMKIVRLKIDVTDDPRADLRAALEMEPGQPQMVFLSAQGRIQRSLDVKKWFKDESQAELVKRVDKVLQMEKASVK